MNSAALLKKKSLYKVDGNELGSDGDNTSSLIATKLKWIICCRKKQKPVIDEDERMIIYSSGESDTEFEAPFN